MLNREPGRKAARDFMQKNQTNAIANNHIWKIVQAVLDAVDEQLADELALTGRSHVITYLGVPIAVCATRARARRWLKAAMLARPGSTRDQYVITHTKIEE